MNEDRRGCSVPILSVRENRMIGGFFPATTMPDADRWQVLWPDPSLVLCEMGVRPGMVEVDLCCGDGLFRAALAGISGRVNAIDIDPSWWITRGRELRQRGRPTAISLWRTPWPSMRSYPSRSIMMTDAFKSSVHAVRLQ
jgi:hypothetical protein